MKIMFAEDDEQLADYVRKGLEEEGHSVEQFSDGRDALAYCLYNDCELAILDRMMPEWTVCPWSRR